MVHVRAMTMASLAKFTSVLCVCVCVCAASIYFCLKHTTMTHLSEPLDGRPFG